MKISQINQSNYFRPES